MNDMETNEQNLTALVGCIELVADAIVKKTCPYMDEISENQAKARYGSKWIGSISSAEASIITIEEDASSTASMRSTASVPPRRTAMRPSCG